MNGILFIGILNKLFNYNCKLLTPNKFRLCFLLIPTLKYLDITIPENSEPILQISFSVFILSLVCLLCFLNVIFFLIGILLIQKYNIEVKFKKYPIAKSINKYL